MPFSRYVIIFLYANFQIDSLPTRQFRKRSGIEKAQRQQINLIIFGNPIVLPTQTVHTVRRVWTKASHSIFPFQENLVTCRILTLLRKLFSFFWKLNSKCIKLSDALFLFIVNAINKKNKWNGKQILFFNDLWSIFSSNTVYKLIV